jgi:hypothetical protein
MLKNIFRFFIALIIVISIMSCGKETQSSTQGGGLFKVRIEINPPLQKGVNQIYTNAFTCNGPLAQIKQWNGSVANSDFDNYESQEVSVTKGQNISIIIGLNSSFDYKCRSVKIYGIINGNIFNTLTKEMGFSSTNPNLLCTDESGQAINFIIP